MKAANDARQISSLVDTQRVDQCAHAPVVGARPIDPLATRTAAKTIVVIGCTGRQAMGNVVFVNVRELGVAFHATGERCHGSEQIEACAGGARVPAAAA